VSLAQAVSRRLTQHPGAHRLARRVQKVGRYYLRRPHEGEYRRFARMGGPGLFLDVGANAGQSAMSFRLYNRVSPILSLEPNPEMEPELRFLKRRVLQDGFDYRMVGAGARRETATLHVPFVGRSPISGEATMDAAEAAQLHWPARPGEVTVQERRVPVVPIDSMGLRHVDYVSIDVEGAQAEVVTGALETIGRWRPVIFCEGPLNVMGLLGPLGYRLEGPFLVPG
jgi:FkbM family methyltransferase